MEINIIGLSDILKKIIIELSLSQGTLNLFIIDSHNKKLVEDYINKKQLTNVNIYIHNLFHFIEGSPFLIIDIKEKKLLLRIIKKWSRLNKNGLLILRNIYNYGMTERIFQWLERKGEQKEVIILPELFQLTSTITKSNFLVMGGDVQSPLTKQFRKKIVGSDIPIILVKRNEAELIKMALDAFLILKKAYFIELENIFENSGVDIELIKKSLIQHQSPINLDHHLDIELKSLSNSNIIPANLEKNLIKEAEKIIIQDRDWIIKKLKQLQQLYSLKVIAVWGIDREDTIKKLIRLPISRIQLFQEDKSANIISPKLKITDDPFLAAEDADVLLILTYNDEFISTSLINLEAKMNKKIIIDKINIFELAELKSLKWLYISKGRSTKNKIHNYWR